MEYFYRALLSAQKRRAFLIHTKAQIEIFHLQKMMSAGMNASLIMKVAMMMTRTAMIKRLMNARSIVAIL